MWRLADIDAEDSNRYWNVVKKLIRLGAVEVVERHRERGRKYKTYRWHPDARADIEQYIEEMDQLPCGCRAHIPNGRGDPDGMLSCKHCGELHSKEIIKECL